MTGRQGLAAVRRLGAAGRVIITDHAEQQIRDAGVFFADVIHAVAHAASCTWQPEHGTWKVKGADRFNAWLVVAVDIQDDAVVVVTVFD